MKKITLTLSLVLITLFACSPVEEATEKEYFVEIYEDYDTEREADYVYILDGFDENGKEKLITFSVEEKLERGSFYKVPTSLDGYTGDAEEVSSDDLPKKAKEALEEAEKDRK